MVVHISLHTTSDMSVCGTNTVKNLNKIVIKKMPTHIYETKHIPQHDGD